MKEQKLEERQLPRDVRTRWNSTYQMLSVAVKYRSAIDQMTGSRELGLRKYELTEDEWAIATQLRDVLKVSDHSHGIGANTQSNDMHQYLY